jgi:hypothetical protein
MKPGTDRNDPLAIMALIGAALLLAAWRLGSSIAPDRLIAHVGTLAPSLAPPALGAVAIASAPASLRLLTTRRTLRSRRVVALVPADEFDPAPDAVLGFAAQLARSRRVVAGWLDRRASAIRVRLTGDADGRLVYLLEVPGRAEELLRSALRSYPGVELRDAADAIGEQEEDAAEAKTVRAELVLGRPSVEPLARLGPDPDPLGAFAAALAGLHPGERASVCLDLLPATGRRRNRLRGRLRRQARRLHGRPRGLAELLGEGRRTGRPDPEELIERRQIGQALDAKLREGGPLFEAQVLVCCVAGAGGRAKVLMRSLLGAFEPLAERNWLRVSGLAIPGLAFLGSDLPVRRVRFDRREATGLFRPARQTILTGREIAGFLKPPTARCPAENVLRSGALLSAPPALPEFDADRGDLIPLGRITGEDGERVVAVRTADTFFSYVAGRSRFGKTETAIAQFVHLARSGHGGLFLDPHSDALERIAPYLATPELARRVVRIDLGPGSADAAQPGWNLFELRGRGTEEVEGRVEAVVDAFASALEWGERSTRAINLTTQAVGALAAIARVLPEELAPTIFQLPTLLGDADWREAVLPYLPRAAQGFWTDRFPLLASEAVTPLTNMVDRLRASTAISTLLGQSQGTYRVREAMDRGLIVLACPGAGGTRERLVANLLLFDLLHAARGRASLAPSARRPFWVFLDEVQSYDGAASGNLAALLEQSAKFGLRAVLLNQNPERLSAPTLNALTTNRSHLLATALNSHAAGLVTKEWGGRPDPAALTRLPRYRFIAQVTHEGELSRPFALGGITVGQALGEPARDCEARAHAVACREPAAALGHLDTLDSRIHADLGRRRRAAAKERGHGAHPSGEHGGDGPGTGKVRVARSRP